MRACAFRSRALERLDGGREQKIGDGAAHFLEGAVGWL